MNQRPLPDLSPQEVLRYARHVVLPAMGELGQRCLKGARVLVIGVGGLGSSIALYLAAAGVGKLGLVDDDTVGLANLQRQVLYGTSVVDRSKVAVARQRLAELNPHVDLVAHPTPFTAENGAQLVAEYDLVVDGVDNLPTRYVINRACLKQRVPYVYGAVFQTEGQVSVLCTPSGPCYECLFPFPPPSPPVAEQAGILGTVPGTIGTLQATEAIKWIAGFGEPLIGRLLVYDGAAARFDEIQVSRSPDCPACGRQQKGN